MMSHPSLHEHAWTEGSDDKAQHLIGIRETRKEGIGPDESLFQGVKTSFGYPSNATASVKSGVLVLEASPRNKARASSCSSSASSQSGPQEYIKRNIAALDTIQMKLDMTQSSVVALIQEYALCLKHDHQHQEQKPSKDLPSLTSCLLCKSGDPFATWFSASTNLLYGGEASELDYHGEVHFRPPTAACASSEVILCAESAKLSWSILDDDGDGNDDITETLQLELFDVSQLKKCRRRVSKGQHINELPVLTEVNEMA